MQYLTATLRTLAERNSTERATAAFVSEQLRRFGCKPKTVGASVVCDVGRGKNRIAFRAQADDGIATDNARQGVTHAYGQTAMLLNAARIVGAKSVVPLRFIFDCGDECAIENDVSEVYALRPNSDMERGKIGYCYGVMCAGRCEFTIDFCAKQVSAAAAEKSAEYVEEQAYALAQARSLSIATDKTASGVTRGYSVTFYDIAACEGFMIDLERAALKADDENGTLHTIAANRLYPPLVNNALAVDRVRSVMKSGCVAVPPQNIPDSFSEYSQTAPCCMVWLGIGQAETDGKSVFYDEQSLLIGTELIINLIESYKA